MQSWPSLEESPWSWDTDISWIEQKEVWANYNNIQEASEYPEWFLQKKPEPCPGISTIILPYIEFEEIFEKEKNTIRTCHSTSMERITWIQPHKV
ncbi:hypothetical protein O181_031054 [Austropuccinia psidii MF-1]|uniref:Uncharacterized protein n=1 Tax=Austropuccinia psidii MF-1 TaxID=1389203 RepID=A0A9Q3CU36_9BASI|nr:hypothetical protein [Austropuccinia psidii MF-1]